MESSIKIEYSGIHEGLEFENKRPVIKIDLKQSDDARDSLLNDLITDQTVLGFHKKKANVFVLYAKPRYFQISELAVHVFNVVKHLQKSDKLKLITSSTEFYFENEDSHSESIDRAEAECMSNEEFTKKFTEVFLAFKIKSGI